MEAMPEISRFLGIVIVMYYRDHEPAHFHAIYGEYEVKVQVETGVVEGQFPRRALNHVLEWYGLRIDERRQDWQLIKESRPLRPIAPLE